VYAWQNRAGGVYSRQRRLARLRERVKMELQ